MKYIAPAALFAALLVALYGTTRNSPDADESKQQMAGIKRERTKDYN